MKPTKLSYVATTLAMLMGTTTSAQELEYCNPYTANVCFGIDWTKATSSDLESINPEIHDVFGRTILHWAAARSNSAQLIKDLIDAGYPVDLKDGTDSTPLTVAVDQPKVSKAVVGALLKAGADLSPNSANHLILHAAGSGEPWLIKMLLDAGADPNAKDFDNFTPLYSAAFGNTHPEAIKMLIKAGADVNHIGKSEDRAQQAAYRPLHAAAKGIRTPEIIHILAKAGANIEQPNRDGFTPLHVAADANRTPEVIEAFAKVGANFNARGHEGLTPLHMAAYTSYPEMVETFIAAGSDVNAVDDNGMSALHFAAIGNGDPAMLVALIEAGAEPLTKDKSGRTPLHYAKKHNELRDTDGDGYRLLKRYSE